MPPDGAVSDDALLDGRVRLRQPRSGYRVAIDPVLLAAAVPARADEHVLDAGAGVGAAALCLAARIPECRVSGIDVQPGLVALANENAAASGLSDRVEFAASAIEEMGGTIGAYDHVMLNPPFVEASRGRPPQDPAKARATMEAGPGLDVWIKRCAALVRPKGTITVIHRADALDRLFAALAGRAGGVTVFPLWPKAGRPAKRVIVRARKGVRSPAVLLPGLVVHEGDGGYTPAALDVVRGGAALGL